MTSTRATVAETVAAPATPAVVAGNGLAMHCCTVPRKSQQENPKFDELKKS